MVLVVAALQSARRAEVSASCTSLALGCVTAGCLLSKHSAQETAFEDLYVLLRWLDQLRLAKALASRWVRVADAIDDNERSSCFRAWAWGSIAVDETIVKIGGCKLLVHLVSCSVRK